MYGVLNESKGKREIEGKRERETKIRTLSFFILIKLFKLRFHTDPQNFFQRDGSILFFGSNDLFLRYLLQIEAHEHDPAHTLLHHCVPMRSRFQTPIRLQKLFFARFLFLLFLPVVITFLPPIVILFTPRRRTNERTDERTSTRTNER
jgi:hypothetical protein